MLAPASSTALPVSGGSRRRIHHRRLDHPRAKSSPVLAPAASTALPVSGGSRRRIRRRRLDHSHAKSSSVLAPAASTAQPGILRHPAPAALPRHLHSAAVSSTTTAGR
nr:unnamed protein product [Digitaria exilis]